MWKDYRNIITVCRDVTKAKAHLELGLTKTSRTTRRILHQHISSKKEYQGKYGATAELGGCPDNRWHRDAIK